MNYNKSNNTGFTLFEILVALALGSLVVIAVLQMYTMNMRNMSLVQSVVETQESGRLSLGILSKSLQMSGYMGCVNTTDTAKVTSIIDSDTAKSPKYDPLLHDFSSIFTLIDNYDDSSNTYFPSDSKLEPVAGSDIIYNRGAMPTNLVVKTTNAIGDTEIELIGQKQHADKIFPGDILMVSDCSNGVIFVVSEVSKTADVSNPDLITLTIKHNTSSNPRGIVNSQGTLGRSYTRGAHVLLMNAYQYFLAPSALVDGHSLYRYNVRDGVNGKIAKNAMELVPYIESLQFRYSVDTNSALTLKHTMSAADITNGLDTWELPDEELNVILESTINDIPILEGADYTIVRGTETPPNKNPSSLKISKALAAGDVIKVIYQTINSEIGPDVYLDAGSITEVSALNNSIYAIEATVLTVGQTNIGASVLANPPPELPNPMSADGRLRKIYQQVIGIRNAGVGND